MSEFIAVGRRGGLNKKAPRALIYGYITTGFQGVNEQHHPAQPGGVVLGNPHY